MAANGGAVRPDPGRPGDRLHRGDPAGVPVPARPRPALLRLQAGQRHPGRRRGEADRPRRRPADRRPGLGDLRHRRLPGAGGAPTSGPSVASDLYTIGRTLAVLAIGVPRLPDHLRGQPARRSTRPRSSSGTTRSTGCWSRPARRTRPTGSPPPTRCASRCSACCARWSPPTGRHAPALHSTASALVRRAVGGGRHARLAGPARRCEVDDRDPQAAWLAVASASPTRRRGCARAGDGARRRPSRCGWRRPAPRSRPAGIDVLPTRPWRRSWPTTRGSGGRSGCSGLAALAPATARPPRRRSFNAVYGQVPGELAPKLALAAGLRAAAAEPRSPSRCTWSAPRTDANYTAPAAFGLARIRQRRAAGPGRRARRARPGAGDQPLAYVDARRAAGRSCWPAPAAGWPTLVGRAGQHRRRSPSTPQRPRPRCAVEVLRGGARRRAAATGPADRRAGRRRAGRPSARCGRAGARLPRAGAA